MAAQMVTVGGFRYRVEDAVRLGLIVSSPGGQKEAPAPENKARKKPANKGGRRADSGGAKRSGAAAPGVSSATS